MSVPVDLAALRQRIDEFSGPAFLVTVGDDQRPHVVSVSVRQEGDRLMVGAGRRTRANLSARPAATLLWPPAAGGEYSLLVDGIAEVPEADSGDVGITAASAVLHRVAESVGDGPTCLPVSSD